MTVLNGDEKSRVYGFLSNGGGTITFRVALTALGPAYVKLGQFLATRPDVVGATINPSRGYGPRGGHLQP